jgi:hypothetical protein
MKNMVLKLRKYLNGSNEHGSKYQWFYGISEPEIVYVDMEAHISGDDNEVVNFEDGSWEKHEPVPCDIISASRHQYDIDVKSNKMQYFKFLKIRFRYDGKWLLIYTDNEVFLCNDRGDTMTRYRSLVKQEV